ncbi:MAG: sugar ABC transporter permease [Clostridiales bacterium]|nr:sugar ABC transporter permease [Clostridiales bacterium]MDY5514389.1 sugar ABC transporter permease [Candidatus Ventricola sp.]
MLKTLRKHKWPYLFICPYFILFLVFQLVPTVWTGAISFFEWDGLRAPKWIGLKNYAMMLRDYMFKDALRNTFIYWIATAIGVLCCALLIACLLKSSALRGKRFFKTVTFLPYVCASVAMGLIFKMLFEENAGLINEIIVSLGGPRVPWLTSSKTARIPVIVLHVWRLTPWYTLIILSGLLNISPEYYEAATVDGATGAQQFFKITLPLLGNILFFCFVTVTVDSWKLFNESYVLAGPGSSNMSLFQLMYTSAFTTFKMGYASALGVVLIAILLTISVIQFIVRRRQGEL